MTKLGLQPGVHGDHEEKEEKDHIKIDPKVFTVLQPTVIPMPVVQEAKKPSSFNWSALICKSLIIFCLFTCCVAALLLLLNVSDLFYYSQTVEGSQKPQMEALLGNNQPKQIDSSVEGRNDNEIVAIPLARVMVVEDISSNPEKKTKIIDGSVEDRSQQQPQWQFQQWNSQEQQQQRPLHPDEIEMMQAARQMQEQQMMMYQQMMAIRQWRMRRLQAALYQQQMQRIAMAQQQQQEEWARQQWAERSRMEEERRQWEMMAAQQQQQQRNQAYWQQYQVEMQRQQEIEQQQQQQQRPTFWQQPQIQQFQQQPQQFFPQIMQQFNQEQQQQQRPTVWQQPPQHFFFHPRPVVEESAPVQTPQPSLHDKIYEELQKKSQNIADSTRPVEMNQPAPQPSMHDKIYEELQKKSQSIPVNAPSRQIWTAITPSPSVEEIPSTQAPTPADEVSDTILRDIFSAFDEQKNSEAANKEIPTTSTTQQPEIVEGKGAVVIEDSFPRLEERTTTPETEEESEEVDDHEKENEEFISVMKFFENSPVRHSEPVVSTTPAPSSTEQPLPIVL